MRLDQFQHLMSYLVTILVKHLTHMNNMMLITFTNLID